MSLILGNNCTARLANALTDTATTLAVGVGEGAKFPLLGAGDWHPLTVTKISSGITVIEIMRVTARTGDVFTVERAQEGTVASEFSPGDRVELRFTAAAYAGSIEPIAQAVTQAQEDVDAAVARVDAAISDAETTVNNLIQNDLAARYAAALCF